MWFMRRQDFAEGLAVPKYDWTVPHEIFRVEVLIGADRWKNRKREPPGASESNLGL